MNSRAARGITLIELMMVITIVGILAGVSSMYIRETASLWRYITFRNDIVAQGRMALMRLSREVRQVRDDSSVYTAGATQFEFDDSNDNRINYQLSGTDLLRNSDVLADSISSLSFVYFNANNAQITTPDIYPSRTDIRRIEVNLTVQSGDQAKTIKAQVYPRNF